MSHPFAPFFEKALAKSHGDENAVLEEAEKLSERGYSRTEICAVLTSLSKGRINDSETAIFEEAIEEFCEEE